MKAGEVVFQVLLDGKIQYRVPLFQRTYSWDEANWQQLWDDLLEVYDAEPRRGHFLGAVVTLPIPDSPENANKFMLIDGQQRLTTLLILLATIRDLARRDAATGDLADEIDANCLRNPFAKQREEKVKFLPTEADQVAFAAVMDAKDAGKTRIGAARRYFEKVLTAGNGGGKAIDLAAFKNVLTGYVNIVSIRLDQDDSPHRIFESLNHTGTPLSDADLVRNEVFMRLKTEEAQRQMYVEHWLPMQQRLEFENGRSELTDFFWRFLMMQGETPRYDQVFEGMREWINKRVERDQATLPDLLGEMDHFSELYLRIAHPDAVVQNPALAEQLRRLNYWEVGVAYPFILFALDLTSRKPSPQVSEADLIKVLRQIESYAVRRVVCGIPTNRLRRIFGRMPRQVSASDLVASSEQYLLANDWPSDDFFAERFLTNPLYQNARLDRTRQVLETLERALGGKEQVQITPTITVEHVMPQTLSEWWREALGPDAATIHETWLHTAGNLTLTGYNSELSNDPFPIKKAKLAESKFALSKDIVAVPQWGADEIQVRGRRLAGLAVKLWPRPAYEPKPVPAVDTNGEVFGLADAFGVGSELADIARRATDLGLHLRRDRYCLTICPPRDKRIALFSVWPNSEGGSFRLWRSPKAFADFIPGVDADAVRDALGQEWGSLPASDVPGFLDRLADVLVGAKLVVDSSEWNWERYETDLHVPPDRLAIAKALAAGLQSAAAAVDPSWTIVFRKGYLALQRPGWSNVAVIDPHYYSTTKFSVRVPDVPSVLGLESPYPGLSTRWYAGHCEWAWFIPDLASLPDPALALHLAAPFHRSGGWVTAGEGK